MADHSDLQNLDRLLNPEQLDCVRHTGSPLLIFAGAGTGKTRVIAYRIAWLIERVKVPASAILAVTFTNKSAAEMRERVRRLIGPVKAPRVTLSTFHSLGLSILRKHCRTIGYHPNLVIYDEDDREAVLAKIAEEFQLGDQMKPALLAFIVHKLKNGMEDPKKAPLVVRRVYDRYGQYLKNYNAVDFDDLILKPIEILESSPEVREQYRKQWRHVLIDEYQDTNPLQYKLIGLLLNREKNIFAVGDDDQSIYGWRGSDISLILNFKSDFRGAKSVNLTRNYRSTMNILESAHAVISRNPDRVEKKLWSDRGKGERLVCAVVPTEEDESVWVCRRIEELKNEKNLPWSAFAVLFRTNFQSRPFEMRLRSRRIPFRLIGGYEFFERKEIKDFLCYLRVIANPRDERSLLRVINYPRRGIGDATIGRLMESGRDRGGLFAALESIRPSEEIKPAASKSIREFVELVKSFSALFRVRRGGEPQEETAGSAGDWGELMRRLSGEIGYEAQLREEGLDDAKVERRMANVSELANHMAAVKREEPAATLWDYLFKVSLLSENDQEKELAEGEDDRVTLLTVHASKGLEFDRVFVAGCENGLFPHRKSSGDGEEEKPRDTNEERRLFYVALTRARDAVSLTACRTRKVYGKEIERELSPFVTDIPTELIDVTTIAGSLGPTVNESRAGLKSLRDRLLGD